jgi:mannose-6-phosphate isomerase
VSDSAPHFDPSNFKTESYVRRIDKPWGYELHFVPSDLPYMGKLIHINAKARLSLQVHDQKIESWFLINGLAAAEWQNASGELVKTELQKGQGYTVDIGQKHRLIGITDCDIIEVSTPEKGITWRLEDDYSRPNETPEQRQRERS